MNGSGGAMPKKNLLTIALLLAVLTCLLAGDEGRLRLGRRRLRGQQPDAALARRSRADLVPAGLRTAVLPPGPHDLLDRVPPLGASAVRLPPRQRPAARNRFPADRRGPARASCSGGLARRRGVRPPPRPRGVGRLDHGAQERPLGGLLPPRDARLLPFRAPRRGSDSGDRPAALVSPLDRALPLRPPLEDRHGDAARVALAARDLEAGSTHARGRGRPPAVLRARRPLRLRHRVDGAPPRGGARGGLVPLVSRANPRGGARGLVLRLETGLAGRSDIHLPALEDCARGGRAVAVPARRRRDDHRPLERAAAPGSRAARGRAVLRRNAHAGPGFLRRLPDAILLRRRSLPVPCFHRPDRPRGGGSFARARHAQAPPGRPRRGARGTRGRAPSARRRDRPSMPCLRESGDPLAGHHRAQSRMLDGAAQSRDGLRGPRGDRSGHRAVPQGGRDPSRSREFPLQPCDDARASGGPRGRPPELRGGASDPSGLRRGVEQYGQRSHSSGQDRRRDRTATGRRSRWIRGTHRPTAIWVSLKAARATRVRR